MAGEPYLTVVGNLTSDPVINFSESGLQYTNFTVASTPRRYNRNTNQWEDGTTMFVRCSAFRNLAENISETLSKGMRVVVYGKLSMNNWVDNNNQKRSDMQLDVEEIGPSLRYATASVTKNTSGGGSPRGGRDFGGGGNAAGGYGGQSQGFQGERGGSGGDPWGSAGTAEFDNNPPF